MNGLNIVKLNPNFVGEFDSVTTIANCAPQKEGNLAYSVEDDSIFYYNEKYSEWQKTKDESEPEAPTLYDINKQIVANLQTLKTEDKLEILMTVTEWQKKKKAKYYMLLFSDIRYYTIFALKNKNKPIAEDFMECLNNIGEVYSIEKTEDESGIEIWVKSDDKVVVGYLFPYDEGVVEIE